MRTPDIYERVGTLEDELQALDSRIDSRTRLLWAEVQKLQGIIEELKAAQQREEK
ncbi:MAG: hypothetical protein GXY42_06995 [Desulfovibrionales bacterium]|nr:hypothetical protein [Desulfovibrionales bacterium]